MVNKLGTTINEIKDKYTILLHKVNEEVIGELQGSCLNTVKNSMNETGEINLEINKHYINQYTKKKEVYPYYEEVKAERMISLDGAFYVIKSVKENTKRDETNTYISTTILDGFVRICRRKRNRIGFHSFRYNPRRRSV